MVSQINTMQNTKDFSKTSVWRQTHIPKKSQLSHWMPCHDRKKEKDPKGLTISKEIKRRRQGCQRQQISAWNELWGNKWWWNEGWELFCWRVLNFGVERKSLLFDNETEEDKQTSKNGSVKRWAKSWRRHKARERFLVSRRRFQERRSNSLLLPTLSVSQVKIFFFARSLSWVLSSVPVMLLFLFFFLEWLLRENCLQDSFFSGLLIACLRVVLVFVLEFLWWDELYFFVSFSLSCFWCLLLLPPFTHSSQIISSITVTKGSPLLRFNP